MPLKNKWINKAHILDFINFSETLDQEIPTKKKK